MSYPKKILVWLDILENPRRIGELEVFESRGKERYSFAYAHDWISNKGAFAIDPALTLGDYLHHSAQLWGCFQDISPDRWGCLLLERQANRASLPKSDSLLGISDNLRLGALRLSLKDHPDHFLAEHRNVPKLVHLQALMAAVQRVEAGQEAADDLRMLVAPGASLGGARPKAIIEDGGALWIAKFPSRTDSQRLTMWEKTAMDLADVSGIVVPQRRAIQRESQKPIYLVKRFDRDDGRRIHFASAMTMLQRTEDDANEASYLDVLDSIQRYSMDPDTDAKEWWARMAFSMVIGNTDDHLRNHGFIRDAHGWRLSPAYDLNFNTDPIETRRHALSFDGQSMKASAKFCIDSRDLFGVSEQEAVQIVSRISKAIDLLPIVAKGNGLRPEEVALIGDAIDKKVLEDLRNQFDGPQHCLKARCNHVAQRSATPMAVMTIEGGIMSETTQSWAQWQTWDAIQASLDAADRMLHKASDLIHKEFEKIEEADQYRIGVDPDLLKDVQKDWIVGLATLQAKGDLTLPALRKVLAEKSGEISPILNGADTKVLMGIIDQVDKQVVDRMLEISSDHLAKAAKEMEVAKEARAILHEYRRQTFKAGHPELAVARQVKSVPGMDGGASDLPASTPAQPQQPRGGGRKP